MDSRNFISFKINGLLFGLNILLAKEFNTKLEITPIHNVPEYIIGVSNLRGQVITVIDLGVRLGLTDMENRKGGAIIVIKTEDELEAHHLSGKLKEHSTIDKVGLLIDEIGDVVEINEEEIVPPPANFNQFESQYLRGIYRHPNNGELQIILNLETCLKMNEISNGQVI